MWNENINHTPRRPFNYFMFKKWVPIIKVAIVPILMQTHCTFVLSYTSEHWIVFSFKINKQPTPATWLVRLPLPYDRSNLTAGLKEYWHSSDSQFYSYSIPFSRIRLAFCCLECTYQFLTKSYIVSFPRMFWIKHDSISLDSIGT